jgi:hypothetical protein
MGIFSAIKDAIFGHAARAQAAPSVQPTTTTAQAAPARPQPVQEVDLEKTLSAMPGADKLNWQTSIVDLMKLLGIDSSYEHRKQLAQEMGRQDYSGSAEDNIWLHKRTLEELAKNGARIPASMLA